MILISMVILELRECCTTVLLDIPSEIDLLNFCVLQFYSRQTGKGKIVLFYRLFVLHAETFQSEGRYLI